MNTVSEVIEYLRKKDYVNSFDVSDSKIFCKETDERFLPCNLAIDEVYRFEGDSNPDDMSVIYAITADSGTRGIILDAYGTYSDTEISEFIKDIPMKLRM